MQLLCFLSMFRTKSFHKERHQTEYGVKSYVEPGKPWQVLGPGVWVYMLDVSEDTLRVFSLWLPPGTLDIVSLAQALALASSDLFSYCYVVYIALLCLVLHDSSDIACFGTGDFACPFGSTTCESVYIEHIHSAWPVANYLYWKLIKEPLKDRHLRLWWMKRTISHEATFVSVLIFVDLAATTCQRHVGARWHFSNLLWTFSAAQHEPWRQKQRCIDFATWASLRCAELKVEQVEHWWTWAKGHTIFKRASKSLR